MTPAEPVRPEGGAQSYADGGLMAADAPLHRSLEIRMIAGDSLDEGFIGRVQERDMDPFGQAQVVRCVASRARAGGDPRFFRVRIVKRITRDHQIECRVCITSRPGLRCDRLAYQGAESQSAFESLAESRGTVAIRGAVSTKRLTCRSLGPTRPPPETITMRPAVAYPQPDLWKLRGNPLTFRSTQFCPIATQRPSPDRRGAPDGYFARTASLAPGLCSWCSHCSVEDACQVEDKARQRWSGGQALRRQHGLDRLARPIDVHRTPGGIDQPAELCAVAHVFAQSPLQ